MNEYRREDYIMGTQIEIIIYSDSCPDQDIVESFSIFKSFEKEFSRFSLESDLTILNTKKRKYMSNRYIDILNLSKEIYECSLGYFNPLINLSSIGYGKSFEKQNFEKKNTQVNLDFTTIQIQENFVSLQADQTLDLGGIVKGYSVDIVKEFLNSQGYTNFIINAGGDIYVRGKSTIAIDSPFIQGDIFALLDIENVAISTSGTYKRKWKLGEEEYHHIISPKTYTNNNEIISISLISEKCFISDAYATACIAMGMSQAKDFLEKQDIIGVLVGRDKRVEVVGNISQYNYELI